MPLTTKGSDKEGIYERTSMPITTITMYKYLIMLLNSSLVHFNNQRFYYREYAKH